MNTEELNISKLKLIEKITTLQVDEYFLFLEKLNEINNTTKRDIVEFSDKEINSMPKNIKKLLLIDKKRCRLRTHPSGKNTITYEIRYRRDGYDISASGKTIELAKANFISKCKVADNKTNNTACNVPNTFNAFAIFYFKNFRSEKVSTATIRTDTIRYNKYLQPFFKETPLKKITPSDCKKLLDEVKKQGKGKTTDELHTLLNVIFKSAIAHGLIDRNPLDTILHITHQRKNGKALTKDEEQRLATALKGTEYATAYMILLYCGLRPNELSTACIDGDFIVATNSKRKNKKVEYKKIPIIKALKPYLDFPIIVPGLNTLRKHFNKILPNHILYDLRTTFYTRCDEYGVSATARDEYVGHSSGVLTNTYRNLSDEYLIEESKKLDLWV